MKIAQLTDAFRLFNPVRDKSDGQGSNRQQQQQQQKDDRQKPDEVQVTDETVGAALEVFQNDADARANGLQAVASGTGPGLRVTLKDGSGAVIRQFTGEEFLRLRDAVSKDGRSRGKILDQKL